MKLLKYSLLFFKTKKNTWREQICSELVFYTNIASQSRRIIYKKEAVVQVYVTSNLFDLWQLTESSRNVMSSSSVHYQRLLKMSIKSIDHHLSYFAKRQIITGCDLNPPGGRNTSLQNAAALNLRMVCASKP